MTKQISSNSEKEFINKGNEKENMESNNRVNLGLVGMPQAVKRRLQSAHQRAPMYLQGSQERQQRNDRQ